MTQLLFKTTKVVHCKHNRYDVYIGRPSKWGNPFVIGRDGSREHVIEMYKVYIMTCRGAVEEIRKTLRGKILGCFCSPKPCHGDVLAQIADS